MSQRKDYTVTISKNHNTETKNKILTLIMSLKIIVYILYYRLGTYVYTYIVS